MTRPKQTVAHVPIERLTAHPGNIRSDLGDLTDMARSIREHGILQPLTATEHPDQDGQLILLAGHRRLGGAVLAGETHVPVIIRHGLDDAAEQLVVMLVENTHRRDLNPVERAEAYGALRNRGLSLTEIARRTGCHVSVVSYYLNLLELDQASRESVRTGRINSTDAISAVRDARQQERLNNGQARRGRKVSKTQYGAWFNPEHPLAKAVRARCKHVGMPKVGSVGCGPCWEAEIVANSTIPAPPPLPQMPQAQWPLSHRRGEQAVRGRRGCRRTGHLRRSEPAHDPR